jgi:hypothetical protein
MQVPLTSNTDSSAGPSRSLRQTEAAPSADADEIAAVKHRIAAVQRKMEEVKAQIQPFLDAISVVRTAKGEGWQAEVARLQQKCQPLTDEMWQLLYQVYRLRGGDVADEGG